MNIRHYTGQIKLLFWLLIAPWVVWQFTLKNSVVLYRECRSLEKRLVLLRNTKLAPETTNISGEYTPLLSNGQLLNKVKNVLKVNQVKVERYTPCFTDGEQEYELYTGELLLSGDYISLLKVMEYIEINDSHLKMFSASFLLDTDIRTRKQVLLLKLIIQQVEKSTQ